MANCVMRPILFSAGKADTLRKFLESRREMAIRTGAGGFWLSLVKRLGGLHRYFNSEG